MRSRKGERHGLLCYPLDQVPTAGPLLSCIIAACVKTVMRQPKRAPTLFALDALPATALAKLDTYIATLGGYGGTLLLYLQTISQLDDVYGKTKAQTILGNCATKLFYRPGDLLTAEHVSKLFGTELRYVRSDSRSSGAGSGAGMSVSRSHAPRGPQTSVSWSEKEAPVFAPTEVDALPAESVLVLAQGDTQVRVLAERLNSIPWFPDLPAPPAIRRPRPLTSVPTPAPAVASAEPIPTAVPPTTAAAPLDTEDAAIAPGAAHVLHQRRRPDGAADDHFV